MEFKNYKLVDVMNGFKYGSMPKKDKIRNEGKYPIYTGYLISGYYDECNIEKETLIVVARGVGGTGDVKLTPDKCFLTNLSIAMFNEEKIVTNKYLYYYFKIHNLRYLDSGSAQSQITINDLKNVKIPIPSIEKQNQIVKILNDIDKKIELNNQINDNLLKLNNQLYEEYFIKNINENADEINLKDLIKVVNGYSYKGNELIDESDIGLATIKNFERKGGFKEDGFKPLNPKKIKEEQIVEKNDILVACTDLTQQADIIGNAVLLLGKAEYEKVIISMDLVKIIPKDNIDKYVVFSILNSREFKNFALGYKSGTTVLHLNKKCFDDFIIKLPANDKLDVFSKMVKTNYEKISNILEENRRLEKLRDTLLPKLMNGEIDLDKIEI